MQPESLPAELLEAHRFAGFQPFAWGGTGTLYLGLHSESGQMALLKLLSASLTAEATERARHHRELRKQLGIAYPHLPRVHEVGDSAGRIWFVREFVSGASLLVRLRLRGALRTPAALAVIAQLASSLDALHRQGLVHRDLKPGHVLFRTDSTGAEVVQLIDTGIPAVLSGQAAEAWGSAAYTAPEIVEGGQATFRSDLYALGCLACELLTGTQAFARATLEDTLAAHRTDPAPELDAAVPAAVRTLIASLLSKDPRRRPFSAQQVRRSLEPFLPDTVPPAPPLPRSAPPPPPPEALGHAADGVKRSSPPLKSMAPALGSSSPAANGGANARRSVPPLGGLGAVPVADGSGRRRSTPPPPPPEALGISGDKARRSTPPAPAGTAANGGDKLLPSKRPPPADATMELRAEELEPASTYVAQARVVDTQPEAATRATKSSAPAPQPASRSAPPRSAPASSAPPRRAPADGTEELDLDALLLQAPTAQDARAALNVPSRVATQRPGSLSAPAKPSHTPGPEIEDSAPTIAIDLSAKPVASTQRVDELAEAARTPSTPPVGAGVSGQVASASPSVSSPPPAAAGPSSPPASSVRSRKSTQMGMGPVRTPAGTGEPDPAERPRTHSGLPPAGPAQVRIPNTFESAAAAAESAAITGSARKVSGAAEGSATALSTPAGRTSFEPVRDAEFSLGVIDLMDPYAEQVRTMRAARRLPLAERPNILLWGAAALLLLALGLRLAGGRGPERASSTSVTVRVPEAGPVAPDPQPSAADPAAAQPSDSQPQPSAADTAAAQGDSQLAAAAQPEPQPSDPPPAAAQPKPVQPPAAAPSPSDAPAPNATSNAAIKSAREEPPTGGNGAPPIVPTVTAAEAGKGFLREPGSVGAGGVVPYRARPQPDSDFKAKARLLYQEGKFQDAAEAYQKASVRTPSDPAAFAGLGASWLAVGDSDRAIAAYQRAIQLKPEVSGFQAALGRAYLAKGDRGRALAAYNKALELDPDNQAARTGAAALQSK